MENRIIKIILVVFGLSYEAVFSKCRVRNLVICRQAIHYFIDEKYNLTLQDIGNITGHDHATVLHSLKSIKDIKDTNYLPYADYIKTINNMIEGIEIFPTIEVKNYSPFKHSDL